MKNDELLRRRCSSSLCESAKVTVTNRDEQMKCADKS